jgi:hypothetical protein
MRRQILLLRFEPQATPPAGDPPSFDVTSGAGTVALLEGDPIGVPTEASYETHVTLTDDTSFVEEGEMALDYGTLRLSTVGAGILEPSGEEGLSKGAVTFEVVGAGQLSGVSGLLSSNFEVRTDTGRVVEHQVVRLFLP